MLVRKSVNFNTLNPRFSKLLDHLNENPKTAQMLMQEYLLMGFESKFQKTSIPESNITTLKTIPSTSITTVPKSENRSAHSVLVKKLNGLSL
jgi:hypothetical protein